MLIEYNINNISPRPLLSPYGDDMHTWGCSVYNRYLFVNNSYLSFKTDCKIRSNALYWHCTRFLYYDPFHISLSSFPPIWFTPFYPLLNLNRERIKEKNSIKIHQRPCENRVFFLSEKDPIKSEFREKTTKIFRIYLF